MDEKGMHDETAMFIISDVAVRKETWQRGPFPKTRWSHEPLLICGHTSRRKRRL